MRVISTNDHLTTTKSRIEQLEDRLRHGDAIILQMEAENQPVGRMVQHWLALLKEYEQECRALESAA